MEANTYEIIIDVSENRVTPLKERLKYFSGDYGKCAINFKVKELSEPYDLSYVDLKLVLRSDAQSFQQDIEITDAENGLATIALDNNIIAKVSSYDCQLQAYDRGSVDKRRTIAEFSIHIGPSYLESGTVEGSGQYDTLTEFVVEAKSVLDRFGVQLDNGEFGTVTSLNGSATNVNFIEEDGRIKAINGYSVEYDDEYVKRSIEAVRDSIVFNTILNENYSVNKAQLKFKLPIRVLKGNRYYISTTPNGRNYSLELHKELGNSNTKQVIKAGGTETLENLVIEADADYDYLAVWSDGSNSNLIGVKIDTSGYTSEIQNYVDGLQFKLGDCLTKTIKPSSSSGVVMRKIKVSAGHTYRLIVKSEDDLGQTDIKFGFNNTGSNEISLGNEKLNYRRCIDFTATLNSDDGILWYWRSGGDSSINVTFSLYDITSELSKKAIVETLTWEQGGFNGTGYTGYDSSSVYRTSIITGYAGERILFLLNPSLNYTMSVYYNDHRFNQENILGSIGYVISSASDFTRLSATRVDGTAITLEDLEGTKIIRLPYTKSDSQYSCVIASSNSSSDDKIKADIVCDGIDDARIINAAINLNFKQTSILLMSGDFIINEIIPCTTNSIMWGNDAIFISHNYKNQTNNTKKTIIHGSGVPDRRYGCTRLITGANINATTSNLSIFRVSSDYSGSNATSLKMGIHALSIESLSIINQAIDKPIVCIDGLMASELSVRNCYLRCGLTTETTEFHDFTYIPVEGLIGIRGVQGSNNGARNRISGCWALFFNRGYDLSGEHFIVEDCVAHHCFVGFAWGDYETRIMLEHPNIMIGCSAEQCFNIMFLGRYGCKTLEELKSTLFSTKKQTLVCIGMSTETEYKTLGLESQGYSDGVHPMLGIKEIIPGYWRGRIEVDYDKGALFTNGGELFQTTVYK